MTIPVWFQDWYNNGSGGVAAAAQTYIDRVEADGGAVESIGCVPSAVWDWTTFTGPLNGSGFIGVLDALPAAQFAVSYRRLTGNYSGNCSQVIRSSDLTSQDIGFVANVEDTASLLSFVSANDGFRSVWYDQSGNTRDASQATQASRPRIVSSGTLDTLGGVPAPVFDGSDDFLALASTLNIGTISTVAFVGQVDAASIVWGVNSNNYIYVQANIVRVRLGDFDNTWNNQNDVPHMFGIERSIIAVRNGASVTLYVDGVSKGTKTSGAGTSASFDNIGAHFARLNGQAKEVIVWTEELTSTQITTYVSF